MIDDFVETSKLLAGFVLLKMFKTGKWCGNIIIEPSL